LFIFKSTVLQVCASLLVIEEKLGQVEHGAMMMRPWYMCPLSISPHAIGHMDLSTLYDGSL
jgi:hypothetical protein